MFFYKAKALRKKVFQLIDFYQCQRLELCKNFDDERLKHLAKKIKKDAKIMEKKLNGYYSLCKVQDYYQLMTQIELMRIKKNVKQMKPILNLLCSLPK